MQDHPKYDEGYSDGFADGIRIGYMTLIALAAVLAIVHYLTQ